MSDTSALLEAGALIPVKTKIDKKEPVDEVSARVYQHAALGDRPVVRLTPDKLAQGDDLEMEFLGFEQPDVKGPLGNRRRQALGFPGWALINDPKHARYALELVKEFKKEVRRAKSKPGHAYDAFMDIGKRLGKSVKHFLPSFWEQVGREFMHVGNATYASRAFGKAREAEKVHALDVDENLRKDAFLEFALAGCLTNKALTEYGKELAKSRSPEEAWTIFRELCVRRTLGGMPPWTSLFADVKSLITAADLDVDEESQALLVEIIESPSMTRAPMGFWKQCASIAKELAGKDNRVAGALLNLLPETNRWDRSDVWKWLGHLREWELLPNVWKAKVPKDAAPEGGAAAWFSKYAALEPDPPQALYDVLEEAAEKLKQDGEPIKLTAKQWGDESIAVDLLDLALELNVPVADPEADTKFQLDQWASPGEGASEDRPRDPKHVQRDKRFKKMLEAAVPNAAGNSDFEAAAVGKKALAKAREAWLLGLSKDAAGGGLMKAAETLDQFENRTARAIFREFPKAYAELKKIDLAPVLTRTIAGGLFDEYGWPILEEVVAKLDPKGKQELIFQGSFPYVIVCDQQTAIVVSPTEIVLEHELKTPKGCDLSALTYADGELCVSWETKRWDRKFYWSSDPKKTRNAEYYYGGASLRGAVLDLEAGGTFNGDRFVHAGDAKIAGRPDRFASDGEHFWKLEWDDDGRVYREVDPATGKTGRKSMPKFFEDFIPDGGELNAEACMLLKYGDIVKESPLGSKNGMIGWRARKLKNGKLESQGIDGRKWTGKPVRSASSDDYDDDDEVGTPIALLNQPGTDKHLPVRGAHGWDWSANAIIWDPENKFALSYIQDEVGDYDAGQPTGLPVLFWNALQVRDEKTSKKLRGITEAQGKKLLAAIAADLEDVDPDEEDAKFPQTEAAVKKWLPGLKHEGLRKGLIGVICWAGQLHARLTALVEDRDPESTDGGDFDPTLEATVQPAFEALNIHRGYGEADPLFPHLQEVAAFIAGERDKPTLTPAPFEWHELLNGLETRIWPGYWSTEDNEKWLNFLDAWADLPFQDLPGKFRYIGGEFDGKHPFRVKAKPYEETWAAHRHQGNTFIMKHSSWGDDWEGLEYAPTGKLKGLPKLELDQDEELTRRWSSAQIKAFTAAAREHEKQFIEYDLLKDAADRVGVSAGEVGLVWFGMPNFDSWENNFLPKPMREHLKLKVKEASAAKQAIKSLPAKVTTKLISSLMDGDPAGLWEDGGKPALDRLVNAWGGAVPKRLAVPTKMIDDLESLFGYGVETGEMLEAMASPKSHAKFKSDAKWHFGKDDDDYRPELKSSKADSFTSDVMSSAARCIPYLNHMLPVGHEARSQMPAVLDATLKGLKSASQMFELCSNWDYDEKHEDSGKQKLEQSTGKKAKKVKGVWIVDDGLVAGAAEEGFSVYGFRPAKLKTEKDFARLQQMFVSLHDIEDYMPHTPLPAMRLIQSAGYKAIAARIKKTPVPKDAYEANPLHSAPELVAKVAKKHKCGEDAAVLYLQLLSLADPTTANIKLWNGWTTANINKAAKELVKLKLVLSAKRARAGRGHFLPGGWEALKLPHLPLETWKLPLFDITRDQRGGLDIPVSRILPLVPHHELFQKAWDRTQSGDEPRYEEVK